MKRAVLISLFAFLLCSCAAELTRPASGGGWLCIEDIRVGGHSVLGTKGAVDSDFGITIFDGNGAAVESFTAGNVPSKVALPAGDYTLSATSANIDSWTSAAGGVGEAAFRDEVEFTIEPEMYSYVKVVAPMVNYGVRFEVEDGLEQWFTAFSLTADGSGGRGLALTERVTGWFDDEKLTFHLNATNTDGDSFNGSSYVFSPKKGHRYTFRYALSPEETQTGGADIEITIDDEFIDGDDEEVIVE